MTNKNIVIFKKITKNYLKEVYKKRNFRRLLATLYPIWFFRLYMKHYLTYPMAEFQKQMFGLCESDSFKFTVIMAFPESGKSTIMNLSFALWAILGKLRKKFVVIISSNRSKALAHLNSIRQELIDNDLLINDFGPRLDDRRLQASNYIALPGFGAKIMATTTYKNIRCLRHGRYRPDLIICDDIEDRSKIEKPSEQTRLLQWLHQEVVRCNETARIVVLGAKMGSKSILSSLKDSIDNETILGTSLRCPIINIKKEITWPGKFKDQKSIDSLRQLIGDHNTWSYEYTMLPPIDLVAEARKRLGKYNEETQTY